MIKLLEWITLVILPAGCALLLAIGFALHLAGRLGVALHLIAPARRADRPSRPERWAAARNGHGSHPGNSR